MKINKGYPKFNSFTSNELQTLQYIKTRGLLSKYLDLNNTIELAFYDLQAQLKKNPNSNFTFHCDFEMTVETHNHRVIIGANVINDYSLCSYFLAIVGKDDDNKKLIRKFHFDFALPSIATKQRVPVFHLQYGGTLSPEIIDAGLSGEKLDEWLSVPRLSYSPVNLALLLDILFCEFKTEETNHLIQGDLWRKLIFDNEIFLTKNYFNNISEHINSASYKKENLLRDFCYGD
jgi:hypothetical protein